MIHRRAAGTCRGGEGEPRLRRGVGCDVALETGVSAAAWAEPLTFICSPEKDEAGPTNNWMDPNAAKHKVGALLDGAMRGRTMYVVPYVMGPVSSPISKVGGEVTDSP